MTEQNTLERATQAFYTTIREDFLLAHEGLPTLATAQKEMPEWGTLDEGAQYTFGVMLSVALAAFAQQVNTATDEDYIRDGSADEFGIEVSDA
jgi:hypothetical protein